MILKEVFVINLQRRKDRLNHIIGQCEKHNLKLNRVNAVDGVEKYKNISKRKAGILGCWESHLKLLKKLSTLKNDYYLIIEDDCVFADNFKERLSSIIHQIPDNWDMIYLGGNLQSQFAVSDFSADFKKALNVLCTHAYIVRKKAILPLIKTIQRKKWKVDVLFCDFQKKSNCFIVIPELTWQVQGFSDIQVKETDNVHLRNLGEKV